MCMRIKPLPRLPALSPPSSRNPHRTNIIGLVLTKDLLNYSLEDEVPIRCMRIRPLPRLPANTGMYAMLKLFRTGRSHMAVLTQPDTGGEQGARLLGFGGGVVQGEVGEVMKGKGDAGQG